MAKSNFEKVESVVGWVRDKKITGYRISKETNAREMSIIALAQGRAKSEEHLVRNGTWID